MQGHRFFLLQYTWSEQIWLPEQERTAHINWLSPLTPKTLATGFPQVHDIAIALENEFSMLESSTPICADNDPSGMCHTWRESGECQKNRNYMIDECRKTCSMCTGTTVRNERSIFKINTSKQKIDSVYQSTGECTRIILTCTVLLDSDFVQRDFKAFLSPNECMTGSIDSKTAQTTVQQKLTNYTGAHVVSKYGITKSIPSHTSHTINSLKMRCLHLMNMTTSKMQDCIRNAEKGLKYYDGEQPDTVDDEDDDIISELIPASRGSLAPHLATVAMVEEVKSSGQLFSGKSEWLMQIWAWFLVVIVFLSALKARKRSIRHRTKLLSLWLRASGKHSTRIKFIWS